MNYRFFAVAGTSVATGAPTAVKQVQVDNNIPVLDWTGEANYVDDGVHPNVGIDGGEYTFRIKYSDIDNSAPAVTQIWVDKE